MSLALDKLKKRPSLDSIAKVKRKIDRFDGLTEDEVQKYTLGDILRPDLDLVFVGINPSLMAAHRGRYYAGPGNHFYKLLHESDLVPRFISFQEDNTLLDYNIGLTNIVARATRSSADLKKSEIVEGSRIVREKLRIFKPKIAVFNGKCIYEVFAEKNGKSEFYFGLQPEKVDETTIWVVPSSSARCAHFPRMLDKLHFYLALKKYLSIVKGEIGKVDESEFRFEGKCKQSIATTSKMWRRKNVSAFLHGGRIANRETVCLDTSEENIDVVKSRDFIITEILSPNNEVQETSEMITDYTNENKRDEMCLSEKCHETKDECSIHNQPNVSLPMNRKAMSKQSLKRTFMNDSPPRASKLRNDHDSMDFMNLIKKRLSEKKDHTNMERTKYETRPNSNKDEKRLKFANLRENTKK